LRAERDCTEASQDLSVCDVQLLSTVIVFIPFARGSKGGCVFLSENLGLGALLHVPANQQTIMNGNHDHHNDDSSGRRSWFGNATLKPLTRVARSFESKQRLSELQQRQQQYQSERRHVSHWNVVSPMTRHFIPKPTSPIHMKRVRSRSFNDYIDKRERDDDGLQESLLPSSPQRWSYNYPHHLLLPPLLEHKQQQQQQQQQQRSSNDALEIPESVTTTSATTFDIDAEPKQHPAAIALSISDDSLAVSACMDESSNHNDNRRSVLLSKEQQLYAATEKEKDHPIWISFMYGMINATIVMPVVMSFGSIIYRNEVFHPYMPVLIKLTLISGVVHQVCFSSLSSLPFAVGSVQDAGLIFLSSMAGQMVEYCKSQQQKDDDYSDDRLLATVTVGLATATAILGGALILVGKLKLATYVQMLPTCVVGGYLAFIGWFCGVSGLGIMVGKGDVTLLSLADNIVLVLPGVAGGILIYWSVRTFKHVAVLPVGIIILLVLFYVGLILTNKTIEDATAHGWIRESDPAPVWYHSWDYLQLDNVDWSALPQLLLTELSMIFVVAFSSSLDVAAIELELNKPLDYNHELTMIGISNVVSGCTGGYTGSYIFSQSIFSLRAGIRSRWAGFVLALCEVAVITTPFPVLTLVPNFFYGSLLTMICVDLMYEWLWDIRHKVTRAEYCICLTTFGLIQLLSVEYGILAGVAVYFVCRKVGVNVGELRVVTTELVTADTCNGAACRNGAHGDTTSYSKLLPDYGSTGSSPASGVMI
jgi:MFS superfamily sulfate permease-like transporter